VISFVSSARVFALSVITFFAAAAFGREAIEDALGGPLFECSGAIAWIESDIGATRVGQCAWRSKTSKTLIGLRSS
jgi:hypothetical protein